MKSLIKGFCLPFILLGAATAFAGTIKEYSADWVDVQTGQVAAKIAATEKKMRVETKRDKSGKGAEGAVILRLDQGKAYVLEADSKTYLEFPLKGDKMAPEALSSLVPGATYEQKMEKLGTETVSGYQAEKFKITATVNVMGMTHTSTSLAWMAKEFDWALRSQNNDKVQEMRNIKVGAQPATLFEIPAGYKKNVEFEEMMKQMNNLKGMGK